LQFVPKIQLKTPVRSPMLATTPLALHNPYMPSPCDLAAESAATEKAGVTQAPASHRRWYWILFLTGFTMRFAFLYWHRLYVPAPVTLLPFSMEVCSIAAHLARGQGFSSPFLVDTGPTAWVAPVYPFFVSLVFRIFGIYSAASALVILGCQSLLAGATGAVLYALGRRTVGERVGLYAAWIWTVSPFFFRWPTSWIWDFTFSALFVTFMWVWTLDTAESGTRARWLTLGALWALGALTNPALLSLLPFSFGYAIYARLKASRLSVPSLVSPLLALALFGLLLCPWLIRNERVFGRFVFLRSNYWFEFHLGNYHDSTGLGYAGLHPGANPLEFKKYALWGEQKYITWAKDWAFQFVRERPAEFASLTLDRVMWFWDGTPLIYQDREWWKPWEFWPLSATGLLGFLLLLTRRPRGWLLLASAVLVYPIPYYLAYPVSKYRHAIEPELVLLSCYLVAVLWDEIDPAARRATAARGIPRNYF
jgi:4-amino-4-deoxy-L-arabinose transferase-like glycosyltransferase